MVDALEAFGIRVEAAHHEVAAGQHEIDFEYGDALRTADNAITFKFALKAIAQQHGLYATFMPKPIYGINGSGMHTHQSLYSIAEARNAFADAANQYGLSDVARSYMAGILAHARGMIAILAPLVNSYKRLVPGYEAPTYLTWGRTNRSALIRVPMVSPGQVDRGDPRRGPLPGPVVEHLPRVRGDDRGRSRRRGEGAPRSATRSRRACSRWTPRRSPSKGIRELPGTLGEAIDELEADAVIREALGDHVLTTSSRPSGPSGTSTGRRSRTGRSSATWISSRTALQPERRSGAGPGRRGAAGSGRGGRAAPRAVLRPGQARAGPGPRGAAGGGASSRPHRYPAGSSGQSPGPAPFWRTRAPLRRRNDARACPGVDDAAIARGHAAVSGG